MDDQTPEGVTANLIYQDQVATLLRTNDWDFARKEAPLVATANTAPFPWQAEYLYPADGIQVRSLYPSPGSLSPFIAQPIRWAEGSNIVSSVANRVLWCSLATPVSCVYTWNAIGAEDTWDSSFVEAVICKLGAVFCLAIAGRIDTHRELMDEAEQWMSQGTSRTY
jgi:hypothetical protein